MKDKSRYIIIDENEKIEEERRKSVRLQKKDFVKRTKSLKLDSSHEEESSIESESVDFSEHDPDEFI